MSYFQLVVASIFCFVCGGLMSAFLLRSNRRFSVTDRQEAGLVISLMVIFTFILGFALTLLIDVESWAIRFQAIYLFGHTLAAFFIEDWLEMNIADNSPLKNQRVITRSR